MSDAEKLFAQAAERAATMEERAAAAARAEAALLTDLRPTKQIAGTAHFAMGFAVIWAIVAVAIASALGMAGVRALDGIERGSILSALVAAAVMASTGVAREMRPAAGPSLGAWALGASLVGFPLVFAANFHDLRLGGFVHEGWPCLRAGLMAAVPAALAAVILLRKGFVLNWKMAGLAAGTLAGLAGLGMLELHCPNLKLLHVVVWHVAVVAASGTAGLVGGWAADAGRRVTL